MPLDAMSSALHNSIECFRFHKALRQKNQEQETRNNGTNGFAYHFATNFKFNRRGVNLLGRVKVLLAKSFISK